MDLIVARQRLRRFVNSQKKVRLTRTFPSERLHNGFIVSIGRDLVAMSQFHDFQPEGYTVLRIKDITNIRSGRYERQWEEMLAAEGTLQHVGLPYDVPLDTMELLLRALQQHGRNIIVECEDPDENLEDFYIGRVLGVNGESLYFTNFDGMGRWDKQPHEIPLLEITKIQFETPYANTFSKYLKGSCPQLNKKQRKQLEEGC